MWCFLNLFQLRQHMSERVQECLHDLLGDFSHCLVTCLSELVSCPALVYAATHHDVLGDFCRDLGTCL